MSGPILYCGDTSLAGAASYLAGVMAFASRDFVYVSSGQQFPVEFSQRSWSVVILSDYPAAMMSTADQEILANQIERGASLLMIGGWESFHGMGGNWNDTPLGNLLPVTISQHDDRVNFPQPCLLRAADAASTNHPVLKGLPWNQPAGIGGLNRIAAKPTAQTLLVADSYSVSHENGATFSLAESFPALVVGTYGRGKTAAFASDVAPHWVGGFVDWGCGRVQSRGPEAEPIEVGGWYAQFWIQLLNWLTPA